MYRNEFDLRFIPIQSERGDGDRRIFSVVPQKTTAQSAKLYSNPWMQTHDIQFLNSRTRSVLLKLTDSEPSREPTGQYINITGPGDILCSHESITPFVQCDAL
jgi:hypothetical protein